MVYKTMLLLNNTWVKGEDHYMWMIVAAPPQECDSVPWHNHIIWDCIGVQPLLNISSIMSAKLALSRLKQGHQLVPWASREYSALSGTKWENYLIIGWLYLFYLYLGPPLLCGLVPIDFDWSPSLLEKPICCIHCYPLMPLTHYIGT